MHDMRMNTNCVCETCAYYNLEDKKLKWINRENTNYVHRAIPVGIENTRQHAGVIREKIRMLMDN
jgi:hypothetical protein